MSRLRTRHPVRFVLAAGVSILGFAALASAGTAVSPSSTPAAGEQYPKKVTICHKTGSKKNPFVTIRVSRNALPAHLRHGDAIGPCATAKFTVCHVTKNGKTQTKKVKGAKAAAKHLRHGDKLGKCKPKKKQKSTDRGKGSEKEKEKPKTKDKQGKPADNPGRSGEKGKPADTPGNGGDKGKGPKK
jgi:hypothetical protein